MSERSNLASVSLLKIRPNQVEQPSSHLILNNIRPRSCKNGGWTGNFGSCGRGFEYRHCLVTSTKGPLYEIGVEKVFFCGNYIRQFLEGYLRWLVLNCAEDTSAADLGKTSTNSIISAGLKIGALRCKAVRRSSVPIMAKIMSYFTLLL